MKKTSLYSLVLFAGVALLASCSKPTTVNPPLPDNSTTESSLAKYQPKPQTFLVDNTAGGSIDCAGGTRLSFIPNVFVDSTGKVINGKVTVQIKEVLNRSQMLTLGITTIDDAGNLIASSGMIWVKATYNAKEVKMKSGLSNGSLIVRMPADTPVPLSNNIFINDTPKTNFTWRRYSSVTGKNDSVSVSGNPKKYVLSMSNVFKWINSDHYYHSGATLSDITVTTFDNPRQDQTRAFIIFKDDKCMLPLYKLSDDKFYASNIPVGYDAYLVVLSSKNDKMWAKFSVLTTSKNMKVDCRLAEFPDTDFQYSILDRLK